MMNCLLQKSPPDDAVYQFLDKKRGEGKPYYVYMTTGAHKFLRAYYGRANEYWSALDDIADASLTKPLEAANTTRRCGNNRSGAFGMQFSFRKVFSFSADLAYYLFALGRACHPGVLFPFSCLCYSGKAK